ncbi:non-ribosomal peptide synthetase [Amycolatopsis aidingensis]|uniref:non-ribosomal peptide synthetase n=1 Tax=Amycolatopsis aidingensis TaxID=2842453 RepID=UPI001C0E1061|nr:non-ribosomal peptide synthetase [Amycolatopsis aidingensis]
MLTHPTDPGLILIEPADLDGEPPPPPADAYRDTLREVLGWARDYLCDTHPELGRRGHVCPFAKAALDGGTSYLAVFPGRPDRVEEVAAALLGYREWFEQLCFADPARAQYHTIMITFPDLEGTDVRRVIDGTQRLLKPDYVGRGLMIGEFHDGPPESGGLWNPDFRPLRSPVPMLAIRNMVPTDFPFLRDDPEFLAGYLGRFGDQVPPHLRQQVADAVEEFGLTPALSAVGTEVPLSAAQRRLWFLSRLDPGNAVHHVARAVRLRGELDPAALGLALAGVVRRHPALRTRLAERDGQPVATIAPATGAGSCPVSLPVTTVDGEPEAARRARALARRPFNLRRGPLLRGALLRLAEDDHVLVLAAHRIAADEPALDLVCAELGGTDGDTAGDSGVAEPVGTAEEDLAYWVRRLAGAPTLDLPADRRRPAAQTYRGATHRFHLPAAVVAGLRDLHPETGSPRIPLLAAFDVVLARHSGQRDLLVGVPAEAERVAVGPLDTVAVLRADLSGDPGFAELVRQCTAEAEQARRHRLAAFEDVVAALDVRRSLGVPPVFQASFAVRDTPPRLPELPGVAAREYPFELGATEVDLTLHGAPAEDGGLDLAIGYSTDLFDAPTVRRLAEHLTLVAAAVISDPTLPVGRIPLLTPRQRAELLARRQGPAVELPDPATPLTLLGAGAAADPEAGAVRGPDGELSYRELHRRAAQLAHVLRDWGAGQDTPVGVCLDRSAAMVVALLGVWLAGAAYVPLDPAFPPERLRHMLADAGVEVVITHQATQERLGELLDQVAGQVCLDTDADVLAALPGTPPDGGPGPDDLAYLIYTSGSTGTPKGVEIPHRAVANLLTAFARIVPLTRADRWLAVTTLSFDIAALELFHPLASGAGLIVASEAETGDGAALRHRAIESGATVLQATPATWRMLLAGGGVPAGIRWRLCGGEAVPRDLADQLAGDGAAVWNVYGPTETTVWSAAGPIAPAPAPVEIGPPIANTSIHVLDAAGEPAPTGVVGEVHIGGLGLARGYRNLPELTAERFVPDPFHPGSSLYATGDLARYRPGGGLEFLGRADHQVKVRGFRIELGEIEAALLAHEGVHAAAVTSWRSAGGDHRLVGYVAGAEVTWPQLRDWLRRTLPEYMVPSTVLRLAELPLTPNGKVDRAALPEPEWDELGGTRRPPGNPVERALAGLWCEVLGRTEIGVDDDFFALGGHSLLGAQLLARVRGYFDTEVPMRSLFEAPTVAGLAEVLVRLEAAPGQATAIAELRQRIEEMPDDEVAALLERSR